MWKNKSQVGLYMFCLEDKRSAQERVYLAAEDYCRRRGLSLREEDSCRRRDPRLSQEEKEEQFRVAKTEKGKPYFANCSQLHLSISHSGDYWLCALAEEEVGVDLQKEVRKRGESDEEAAARFEKMAGRFFHEKEAEFVSQNRYQNFFEVWTAKESYVKYTGQGIDGAFSRICVLPETAADQDDGMKGGCWEAAGVHFTKVPFREGYHVCVCTKQKQVYELLEISVEKEGVYAG